MKVPREVQAGRKDDPLLDWISRDDNRAALLLAEAVDVALLQHVVSTGYADDLTDDQVEELGRDPFLIAYALSDPAERCVVTTEVSKPKAQRQNRRIPDVCQSLGVQCCGPSFSTEFLDFTQGGGVRGPRRPTRI
jgi:hypothetical protein